MMIKRNSSIELYRCLLMFGIVLLHCAGKGASIAPWLGNLLKFCVTGFVFISGYYGIKFSWRKLGKLYALGVFCAFIGAMFQVVFGGSVGVLPETWNNLRWFWFLHAYAILMFFAPILNLAFECRRRELVKLMLPIAFLLFGWSFCYEIGHLRPYVLHTDGLGSHTALTLIGVYLMARWFRVSEIENKITTKSLAFALILLPMAAIGLAPYNSIFAFIMAASCFLVFKRLKVDGDWSLYLSPSMLSVYFLHSTRPGMLMIHNCVKSTGGSQP